MRFASLRQARQVAAEYDSGGEARLFAGGDETLNLAIPVVLLAVSALALFLGWDAHQSFRKTAGLIFNLYLLNNGHILFTFLALGFLPELRTWSRDWQTQQKKNLWARTFLVFAGVWLVLWLGWAPFAHLPPGGPLTKNLLKLTGSAGWWMLLLPTALTFFLPAHHTLSQMRGLSYAYNANFAKSVGAPAPLARVFALSQRLEYWGTVALLSGAVAGWPILHLPLPAGYAWVKIGVGAVLLSSLALIALSLAVLPVKLRRRKCVFHIRYMVFALGSYLPIPGAATAGIHGTEYLFVFRGMVSRSAIARRRRWNLILCVPGGLAALAILTFPLKWTAGWFESVTWISLVPVAVVTHTALVYAHYHLDSLLFAMRNPLTRAMVAPLLQPVPPAHAPDLAPAATAPTAPTTLCAFTIQN